MCLFWVFLSPFVFSRGQRFGEMERDVLVGYATPELLLERLCRHSDIHNVFVCMECGKCLKHTHTYMDICDSGLFATGNRELDVYVCSHCKKPDTVRVVQTAW